MSVLFSFCVQEGGEDAVLDILDDVLEAGVEDSEWEWLSWTDVNERVFCVIRGSLSSRGAFLDAEGVRQIRLSVAHRFASDNRCEWDYPSTAQEGREQFDEWLSDAGVEPLDDSVFGGATLPPPKPSKPSKPTPMILRGRERLEEKAVVLPPPSPGASDRPNVTKKKKSEYGGGGQRRQQGQARPKVKGSTSVLDAFRNSIHGEGSDGKGFSLYGFKEDVEGAGDDSGD